MLTVIQVSEYLNVSRNTVYAWCNSGELPSFKNGNTRRIRKDCLLNWIKEQEKLL
nr:helix-turn-helix domain-containing protein [Paenibacillus selenitireducens]